jgi:undecaprenyl-diphosphatase
MAIQSKVDRNVGGEEMRSSTNLAGIAALFLIWLAMLLIGGSASALDGRILGLLHAGDRPALSGAAALLTAVGGWVALTVFALLATAFLFLRDRRRKAALLLVVVLGGRMSVELQKYLGGRPRPAELDQLVAVHSKSFPSGHAANSMITCLAIALLLLPRRLAIAAAILLSLLIGLSRIMLGVHWPSDVVGGWAFGLFWTLALVRFAEPRGTRLPASALNPRKETNMADETDRRPDDSAIIDRMEEGPGQSGSSGGNLQRDVAARDEEEQETGEGGVTRVHKSDKPDDGDEPNLPNR